MSYVCKVHQWEGGDCLICEGRNEPNRDEAIRMLRDAYKHILAMRADELPAYVWARTLGTLHLAKEQLLNEGMSKSNDQLG